MVVEAHAKINLTLEILGVREDGYHEIKSVVAPISLCDELEINPSDVLSCDSGFADELCIKAARRLDEGRGAKIAIRKRIPVGGGLGGGSADAAATLKALNEMWGLGRAREELLEIAAEVGSDVPALVMGGFTAMEGRGELVRPVPARELDLVLWTPEVRCSTAEVYSGCVTSDLPRAIERMLGALEGGDLKEIAASLWNGLEPAAAKLHPEIEKALSALKKAGVLGAAMSGSGSTVFGLVESREAAKEISASLSQRNFGIILPVSTYCPVM